MSVADFFTPVSAPVPGLRPGQLGARIRSHERTFPDLEHVSLALFGVEEERHAAGNQGCARGMNALRPQLYTLFEGTFDASKIADLGDIKQGATVDDTYFALKTVVSELIKQNIVPVIIGGSNDLAFAQYLAYGLAEQKVELVAVDNRFDLDEMEAEVEIPHSDSYLNKIILHEPNWLFNYSNLGYQSYFVTQNSLRLMEKMYFDVHRLGQVVQDLQEAEPVIRGGNMLSFDISAIRSPDAPGNGNASPNGLYGEQACQLCRYAGINGRLLSAGFYEFNPRLDRNGQTAQLLAQMVWYFMDGFFARQSDYPFGTHTDFVRYRAFLEGDGGHEVIFYKSSRSDRWWMQVPYPEGHSKNDRFHLVPCSYKDYQVASNGEMPDRWWKTYQKLL
ncbi:MAG TPA: formimidoylglutamase [Anseongella sp.]|nr:formimidoylglutamase [Anseongella sp.]